MVAALTGRIKVVAISAVDSIVVAAEEAIEETTMTAAAVEGVDSAVVEVVVEAETAAVVEVEVVDSRLADSSSTVKIDVDLLCPMKEEVDFLVDLVGWPSARCWTLTPAEALERVVLQLE